MITRYAHNFDGDLEIAEYGFWCKYEDVEKLVNKMKCCENCIKEMTPYCNKTKNENGELTCWDINKGTICHCGNAVEKGFWLCNNCLNETEQ